MQVFINQINIEFIKGEQQQKPLNILVLAIIQELMLNRLSS